MNEKNFHKSEAVETHWISLDNKMFSTWRLCVVLIVGYIPWPAYESVNILLYTIKTVSLYHQCMSYKELVK